MTNVKVNYIKNGDNYYIKVRDIVNMLRLLETKETNDLADSLEEGLNMLKQNSLNE